MVSVILQKWPSHRKNISILGLLLLTIALFAASFATAVSHLILTQGLLYGIGGALLYNPFIFYLDEWFIERRGLAYGIFWAGTGVCGTVVPLMMEWGLAAYGFRTVLRVWGAFVVCTLSLSMRIGRDTDRGQPSVRDALSPGLFRSSPTPPSGQGQVGSTESLLSSHHPVLDLSVR